MNSCALCGGHTRHEPRKRMIGYRGHNITIDQPAYYCDSCGEAFLTHNDSKTTEKEITDFKRSVDHLLTSEQIKQIRKKAKITQKNFLEVELTHFQGMSGERRYRVKVRMFYLD